MKGVFAEVIDDTKGAPAGAIWPSTINPNIDPYTSPPHGLMPQTAPPMGYYWAYNFRTSQYELLPEAGYFGYVYSHNKENPVMFQETVNVNTVFPVSDLSNNINAFVQKNKTLVYLGVGLAAYYFFVKK